MTNNFTTQNMDWCNFTTHSPEHGLVQLHNTLARTRTGATSQHTHQNTDWCNFTTHSPEHGLVQLHNTLTRTRTGATSQHTHQNMDWCNFTTHSPEHGLVHESFVSSDHVLSGQSTADVGMIVMLHPPTTEVRVKETRHVSCLAK